MQKHAFEWEYEVFSDSFKFDDDNRVFFDKKMIVLPSSTVNSLHYHNCFEIGICFEGTGLFYNSHKTDVINKGDIVLFYPATAHYSKSLHSGNPCMCRFAFIDSANLLFTLFKEKTSGINLISKSQSHIIPTVIRKEEYPEIYRILHVLLKDIFENHINISILTAMHFAEFLIKVPLYFPKNQIPQAAKKEYKDDMIFLAEAFLSSHYNENISISQLCEICNLSESQLRRRFKQKFGIPPFAYLHNLRCSTASELLLHTDLSVLKIAKKVGYLDSSEFYKHFSAFCGQSPTAFRKKQV